MNLHNNNEFVIFHPSRHDYNKRNDLLIDSCSEVIKKKYDIKLIMIEWGDFEKSKKLINKLGIEKNVEWIKPIDFMHMNDFYNASDIICDQFAIQGCLCLTTLESMACKKPVLTLYSPQFFNNVYSKLPTLPTIISKNDITSNIINLLENPFLRKKFGESGYQWVHEEYSQKKILSILCESYSQLNNKKLVFS